MKHPLLPSRLRPLLLALLLLLAPVLARAQALLGTFAAGTYHSLAIHADGTLWATGDNYYGELGTGTTTGTKAWVQVGTASNWVQVAVGEGHSLGLRADGTLWAWGNNRYGQLGNLTNSTTDTANPTPRQVAGTYTQVAAGAGHSLGLQADGSLWAWGGNYVGQLGTTVFSGTTLPTPSPTQVPGTYVQIAAGGVHNLALRADGSLWTWGSNYYGQLGNATNTGSSTAANPTPTQVAGTYTQVAAGLGHSLALRTDGSLWAWGWNNSGQLGNLTNVGGPTPTQVAGTYTRLAAGGLHSLGLRADGSLWAWGSNYYGQLGSTTNLGSGRANATPQQVAGTYTQVAAGGAYSLALQANGTLWAWGTNSSGQLGNAIHYGSSDSTNPTPTATGTALPTRSLAAGSNFGLAVRPDGTLWAWGDNTYGQLGDGTTTSSRVPHQAGPDHDWVQVTAGNQFGLGLKADGSLWAWGHNNLGQLGTTTNAGTSTANPAPSRVGTARYTRLAAGSVHSLALQADGSLWAWGNNYHGELGNPTNAGASTPNPIPVRVGTEVYRQVAAGIYYSLGLRADGSLWAWGTNDYGQLGNGTFNQSSNPTPTRVGGAASSDLYLQAGGGDQYGLGLRPDGTVWAWGNNYYGQLGNGTTGTTNGAMPTPAPVGTARYKQVAAGYASSLALQADGTVWGWGENYYGQLGLGTFGTPRSTPTQEATLGASWTTLATSTTGSVALVRTASGLSFASAGSNSRGELGDGTTTNSPRFDRLHLLPVREAAGAAGRVLALYPNPASDHAAMLSGAAAGQFVQVLDALGRPVATATADVGGTARLVLPVGLAAGLYVVRAGAAGLRLVVL